MRAYLLAILVFGCSLSAMAQAYLNYGENSEIKFNAGLFLATSGIEASFEHYIQEDISLGGTVSFDHLPADYNGSFSIGPNLRGYFGYLPRSGFFVEAFGLYTQGEYEEVLTGEILPDNSYNHLSLGLGAGNKWVTRNQRFSLEVFAGIGRVIQPDFRDPNFVYRGGLNLGFRF